MLESYITFRSLTQAQQGKRALQAYGIDAHLTRAPKTLAEKGCTHALLLESIDLPQAANALRAAGVAFRKIVRLDGSGNLMEVRA